MLAQKAIVIYAKTAAAAYSGDAAHIPFRCVPPFGLDFQQRLKWQSNVWEGKNKTWSETTEMQESGKERGRWRRALAIVKLPPAVTCEGGSERASGRARNPREAKEETEAVCQQSETRRKRLQQGHSQANSGSKTA